MMLFISVDDSSNVSAVLYIIEIGNGLVSVWDQTFAEDD